MKIVTKVCSRCKIEKPLEEFARKTTNKANGRQALCKPCDSRSVMRWKRQAHITGNGYVLTGYEMQVVNRARQEARRWNVRSTLTHEDWAYVLHVYERRCAYCLKEGVEKTYEQIEHVEPFSLGGENTIENVVPTCAAHNYKKRRRTGEPLRLIGADDEN